MNLSNFQVECASLRRARGELDAKVGKFDDDLECALKAVFHHSMEVLAQMAHDFEVQLVESLKCLKSDFRLKGSKVSSK